MGKRRKEKRSGGGIEKVRELIGMKQRGGSLTVDQRRICSVRKEESGRPQKCREKRGRVSGVEIMKRGREREGEKVQDKAGESPLDGGKSKKNCSTKRNRRSRAVETEEEVGGVNRPLNKKNETGVGGE